MKAGAFERDTRWVGGTINDIVQTADGAHEVIGVFEVGVMLPEKTKRTRTRTEILQYLRAKVIDLAIFGDNPSIGRLNLQGMPPAYAETAELGIVAINYRVATENDIPIWPGIVELVSKDKEGSIHGNI